MWVVPAKPRCYLRMFPDLLNQEDKGEVFQLQQLKEGDASFKVNREKWERCQDCHCYRHCYDLGMAALALSRLGATDY